MTIEEIVALLRQKLADSEAVSPGPWSEMVDCSNEAISPRVRANVALVVAMRNHLPALLDAIEQSKDDKP